MFGPTIDDNECPAPARRLRWFFAVALLAGVLSVSTVASAHADAPGGEHDFCTNAVLQPFGQSGDRCGAGHGAWGPIIWVAMWTTERAGCVNYEGYYGELYTNWTCYPNYSSGMIYVPHDGGSYDGIIRNNNLSYSGVFRGAYTCCWN